MNRPLLTLWGIIAGVCLAGCSAPPPAKHQPNATSSLQRQPIPPPLPWQAPTVKRETPAGLSLAALSRNSMTESAGWIGPLWHRTGFAVTPFFVRERLEPGAVLYSTNVASTNWLRVDVPVNAARFIVNIGTDSMNAWVTELTAGANTAALLTEANQTPTLPPALEVHLWGSAAHTFFLKWEPLAPMDE